VPIGERLVGKFDQIGVLIAIKGMPVERLMKGSEMLLLPASAF
jgi:hypothetical protein